MGQAVKEYAIFYKRDLSKPHRGADGSWDKDDCEHWIKEAVEDDGFDPDTFILYERTVVVSEWTKSE